MILDVGKTLRSSIQQSAFESGQPHFTVEDVIAKRALTAEWTTNMWQTYLKINDLPQYSARESQGKSSLKYRGIMTSHFIHTGLQTVLGIADRLKKVWNCSKCLMKSWREF